MVSKRQRSFHVLNECHFHPYTACGHFQFETKWTWKDLFSSTLSNRHQCMLIEYGSYLMNCYRVRTCLSKKLPDGRNRDIGIPKGCSSSFSRRSSVLLELVTQWRISTSIMSALHRRESHDSLFSVQSHGWRLLIRSNPRHLRAPQSTEGKIFASCASLGS